VSHNMTAVQSLCQRALMLAEGRMMENGPVALVIARYLQEAQGVSEERRWTDPRTAPGNDFKPRCE